MNIKCLDHLVLTVENIDATVEFYERVLGMKKEMFGEGRIALKFGNQKINLHQMNNEFEPRAQKPTPGSADLCFLIEGSIKESIIHIEGKGVKIIEGPANRTGANGPVVSIYFRDPDNNLIELATEAEKS